MKPILLVKIPDRVISMRDTAIIRENCKLAVNNDYHAIVYSGIDIETRIISEATELAKINKCV